MPFVRCRFYTENGEPLRGGCRRKGGGCGFIHPEDSDWINAPPSSFKPRDKSGDTGGFKPWGGNRSAPPPTAWGGGGSADTNTADTGGGWDSGGGWGDVSGWDPGSGWDAGSSTSTSNQVPEPADPKNTSTKTSLGTSAPVNEWNQAGVTPTASGNTKSSEYGWGGGADKSEASGWGSTGNDGWGASSWGDNKDATNSWGPPDPMIVDDQAEKETDQNKGKGKAVPAPPRIRIRIPDNENKKTKTGTNNEPLGRNRWGEPRRSNPATTSTPVTSSTPVTTSTPVATITPTELSSSRVKRKRDAVSDDKLDAFKEYVKTWERGVRTRFLLAEAEAKRDRWFRTQKSACYARIGEAGRNKLDAQRAECDKEVSLQREKLSGAITSLVGFHDTISSNLDLGQRYNIGEEVEKFITDSKAFVDEVRALLVAHVLRDKNDVQSGDMEKRPSGADATLIDSLQSQVRDLEERFDQAQTELTLRHHRDIRCEIDELLATKIAALRVARRREMDGIESQPRAEIVIPPRAIENMKGTARQVEELDAKVPHTVEDIRVLLLRVDATTKRVSQLEEELSVNKATYTKQVQEMSAEKEETERRMNERLEKIREQFEQLVASQPPPAQPVATVSPTIYNSRDKLMESLRPAFEAGLDKFYERQVRPTVESLQRVVIETSDRHQEEAIRVLWGKIQPAMNMVAGVSRWLDSQELGLTAPVEADDTYAGGFQSRTNFHS